jgi:hypothetical protein
MMRKQRAEKNGKVVSVFRNVTKPVPKIHAKKLSMATNVVGFRQSNDDAPLFYFVRQKEKDGMNYSVWVAVRSEPNKRGRKDEVEFFPFYTTLQ